jgi:hypothetical protein
MPTYTIDWSDNTGRTIPIHSGLDSSNKITTLVCDSVLEMKEQILSSLDSVKANKHVHKWELTPMSYYKVELRDSVEVYTGWIEII